MSKYEKYQIYAALHTEENDGWVWLRFKDAGIPDNLTRPVIRIRSKASDEIVYCEARNIDKNYEYRYTTRKTTRCLVDDPLIIINEWHRKKLCLGGREKKNGSELLIVVCNDCLGRIFACFDHPQVIVRIAITISIISVGLGIIAFFK